MTTSVTPFKIVPKTAKKEDKKSNMRQEQGKRRPTLKEYHFLDSDAPSMFDDLVIMNLITLPKMKRPNEDMNTDDPNYCKYHCLVEHPIKNSLFLKTK